MEYINFFMQKNISFSKNELKLLSNMPQYLKEIYDAKNQLLSEQSSYIKYTSDGVLDFSKKAKEVDRIRHCIDTNLLMLNELIQYATTINNDIQNLWNLYKANNEKDLKIKYNLFKPTVKIFIHYINENKKIHIKNNTIIHKFLKKAEKHYEYELAEQQFKKAKHQKTYQSKLLLITENKIFLPYCNEEIQKILDASSTKNVEDIINKKYVITNVKRYRSSKQNRFTLGYKLSKNTSKNSTLNALKFALKISRIKNLHPAIIQACSSQDQLENYIMFLNQGNPSAFTDFEVKFQINPI